MTESKEQEAQPKLKKWTNLYQNYRPFQLASIVGQKNAVKSLTNSARRDSFNHAYLFVGDYGCGKTSFARILASLMVCPNRKPGSVYVCGTCRYCLGIHAGHCVDVMEINGANQTGVEEARELERNASVSPQELKKKIYIIDEVHKLSDAAKSALLKILEEPPPNVHFIFCTTERDKVLPTIVSRCQRFLMTKIPSDLMAERIDLVASKEGISLEPGVSRYVARLSDGSLRDGLGNLEQIAVFSDGKVTLADSESFFGLPSKKATYEVIQMIASGNVSGLLLKVNDLVMSAVQPKEVMMEVSNILRNVFIMKSCGKDSALMDVNDDERLVIEELSSKLSQEALLKMANSLSNIEKRVAVHINERWIVEAALVNCAQIANNDVQNSIKQR